MKQQGLFFRPFSTVASVTQQFLILHGSMYLQESPGQGLLLNAQDVHPGWKREAFSNVL